MKIICMIRSLCLGGAERQLAGLAVQLSEKGHDVEVLTYHEGDFYLDTLLKAGVRHTFIPKDRHIVKKLAEHFEECRPDLVIAFLVGPSVKACKAKKYFSGFRLAVSERNVNTWTGPHDAWRFHIFSKADFIIPNSNAQAAWIRKHFPSCASKVRTIVNFVDTDAFTPAPTTVRNDPPRIVTAARVDSRKNVHGYIKALKILKESGVKFKAEWYGLKTRDAYYRKCLAAIRRSGLEDCFSILPATKDIASVYRSSDIFCLPSFYEGTPNALSEALASGLPAVASRVSDNALYLPGDCLFDPHDPRGTADALSMLLCSPDDVLERRRQDSRHTALTLLGKETFIGNYSKILEEIQSETL